MPSLMLPWMCAWVRVIWTCPHSCSVFHNNTIYASLRYFKQIWKVQPDWPLICVADNSRYQSVIISHKRTVPGVFLKMKKSADTWCQSICCPETQSRKNIWQLSQYLWPQQYVVMWPFITISYLYQTCYEHMLSVCWKCFLSMLGHVFLLWTTQCWFTAGLWQHNRVIILTLSPFSEKLCII